MFLGFLVEVIVGSAVQTSMKFNRPIILANNGRRRSEGVLVGMCVTSD